MENKIEYISTKDLVEELSKRTGTQELWIKPYQTIEISIDNKKQDLHIVEGPAKLVLVYD